MSSSLRMAGLVAASLLEAALIIVLYNYAGGQLAPLLALALAAIPVALCKSLIDLRPVAHGYMEVLALADRFSRTRQHEVDLMVRRNDVLTGCDSGIVTFTDGRLNYKGINTAFTLCPQDVRPVVSPKRGFGVCAVPRSFESGVFVPDSGVTALFASRIQDLCFADEFGDWLSYNVPCYGESILPPSEVKATTVTHAELALLSRQIALVLLALQVGIVLCLARFMEPFHSYLWLFGCYYAGALAFTSWELRTCRAWVDVAIAPAMDLVTLEHSAPEKAVCS